MLGHLLIIESARLSLTCSFIQLNDPGCEIEDHEFVTGGVWRPSDDSFVSVHFDDLVRGTRKLSYLMIDIGFRSIRSPGSICFVLEPEVQHHRV